MLYFALAISVVLMHSLGMFQEFFSFREMRLLDEHIMQAYDDGAWEDRMETFHQAHPRLHNRSYMALGSRR